MLLMHKNIEVAEIRLWQGQPMGVIRVMNPEHMPVGLQGDEKKADMDISSWNSLRAIPVGRIGLEGFFEEHGTPQQLTVKSFGLSLTDAYWYNPGGYRWEDVSLHKNGFTPDIMLFRQHLLKTPGRSPDYTTNGMLEKFWITDDSFAYLLKSGDPARHDNSMGYTGVLAANEVVAMKLASIMGIPHADYARAAIEGIPGKFCSSRCIIADDRTELIAAASLFSQEAKYTDHESLIGSIIAEKGYEEEYRKMLTLDFLLHNYDRHLSNFGLLRDSDSLEYTGFAPLYDSGSCLGWSGSHDAALRPTGLTREATAALVEKSIIPDEGDAAGIIADTYNEFGVPQKYLDYALDTIRDGYNILARENSISTSVDQRNKKADDIEI